VRLLLDTHIAIWALIDDRRLGKVASSLIDADDNEIFVSAVSILEIAIKRGIHKAGPGRIAVSATDALLRFERAGFLFLDISPAHAAKVEHLPGIHGDPFDRLLVAQAMHEPMKLLTRDAILGRYGEMVVRV
jgi:PIN domain nuclease of toxin-antitoxin system